jgi:hypothetical protein
LLAAPPDGKLQFKVVSSVGQIKFSSDAGQFLERVQPFLLGREAEHCLTLGLLDGLRAGEQWGPAPPLLALAEDRDEVTAVAVMTPPHNLVLSWTADDSTIDATARELHTAGVSLPGVNGSAEIARKFAARWSEHSGCTVRKQMSQRIYQLSRVRKELRAAGRLREPGKSDETLLLKWRAAFSVDAEGLDPAEAERIAEQAIRRPGQLVLWEVDGQPVSMAGFTGRTPKWHSRGLGLYAAGVSEQRIRRRMRCYVESEAPG